MSSVVKLMVLTFVGVAIAVIYNQWVGGMPATAGGGADLPLGRLDLVSYGAGLVAGFLLWQFGDVKWGELPARARAFVLAQTRTYQFVAVSAACLAVLFYF
jgi:hypothetical protein